jgi:hypothetical protein
MAERRINDLCFTYPKDELIGIDTRVPTSLRNYPLVRKAIDFSEVVGDLWWET